MVDLEKKTTTEYYCNKCNTRIDYHKGYCINCKSSLMSFFYEKKVEWVSGESEKKRLDSIKIKDFIDIKKLPNEFRKGIKLMVDKFKEFESERL